MLPQDSNDYRKFICFFDANQYPYHAYHLPKERKFQIFIKDVPTTYNAQEVHNELQLIVFHPQNTYRMTKHSHAVDSQVYLEGRKPHLK